MKFFIPLSSMVFFAHGVGFLYSISDKRLENA